MAEWWQVTAVPLCSQQGTSAQPALLRGATSCHEIDHARAASQSPTPELRVSRSSKVVVAAISFQGYKKGDAFL
jgi:hypothetical protein